ncbi:MAG: hypothetical protein J0I34_21665 [Pseudonocardia sp.]|uniref:hypothetical protein n=1 Tax=unclassified Pseudonocardia TaxID=2619320 RepID=UPI00086C01F2|nr:MULTISPECIES: hypothetical protein [unclassified Pseudonocardia]MBN9111378.1 hypothetical protein [Pseudonocardia sp.]ODU22834.1 MAG: hypothetical protein ABS80_16585 [Pseudonocardia sp. SCN 72-51]ODV05803.1 MAG: hypothetical protein ABT15_15245 [Pseudonocardia sp. SCN 73-27]
MGTVTAAGVGMIMGLGAVLVVVLLPHRSGGEFLGQWPTPAMRWTAVVMGAASTAAAAALLAAGQPAAGLAAASFGGLGVFLVDAHRRDVVSRPVPRAATGRLPGEGGGFWLFILLLLGDR